MIGYNTALALLVTMLELITLTNKLVETYGYDMYLCLEYIYIYI